MGDGKGVSITARAVYRGIVYKGDGSKEAIKLDNYACFPGLTKLLFSVNTALDKGFDIKKKNGTLCLFKNGYELHFNHKVKSGSSFLCGVKMKSSKESANPSQEKVVRFAKDSVKVKKERIKTLEFQLMHELIGHPSNELTSATAKSLDKKLEKGKIRAWPVWYQKLGRRLFRRCCCQD